MKIVMTTVKEKVNGETVFERMLADKARIEAHYANPKSVTIDDIKLIQPLPVSPVVEER
jgi:hypothetical protein